jgi:hypothetical protein
VKDVRTQHQFRASCASAACSRLRRAHNATGMPASDGRSQSIFRHTRWPEPCIAPIASTNSARESE